MKELKDLLKQGESLMREIRETLDKPKPEGVIARPGTRVRYGNDLKMVTSRKMWERRCAPHVFLGEKIPVIGADVYADSYKKDKLTDDRSGQPIIGYEDDA